MDANSLDQFNAFFSSIASWRSAYRSARLHVLASRSGADLTVIAARIYLDAGLEQIVQRHFRSGSLEAFQWEIPQSELAVEGLVKSMVEPGGLYLSEFGRLRLPSDHIHQVFAAPPALLHPEGLNSGNRLAVLTIQGAIRTQLLPQPDTDWRLKAADKPFDSVLELCNEFGLGALSGDRVSIEVVARTAVEVLARSEVKGTLASLGISMAATLDKAKAKIGYRVLEGGKVTARGSLSGADLTWQVEGGAAVGTTQLNIAAGALVQCIASYEGQAHQVQWRVDPSFFQNPRAAVLSLVDSSQQTIRSYLQPDLPPRGKAAEDFEAAVGWLMWAVGFSMATFGTNSKTKDAFDMVAVSPKGDFVVVECTLGLLRADSKLSKLAARTASVREALDASNMKHLRVLPVIVTAMTTDQVKADVAQAEEVGILVLTKENLDEAFNERLRFPNADSLFERAMVAVQERQAAREAAKRPISDGLSIM